MNEKLRQARISRRWSVDYAALRIGIGRTTYTRWEQGIQKPHESGMMLACKAFNLSPEQLGFEKEASSPTIIEEKSPQTDEGVSREERDRPSARAQATYPAQTTVTSSLFPQIFEQTLLLVGRELEGVTAMTFDPSKRETLRKLTASLLTLTGLSQVEALMMFNSEPHKQLVSPTSATSTAHPEELLQRSEQLIEHCWTLSKGKQQEMSIAKAITAGCLPELTNIAQQPSFYQQRAADLAAQWYRLYAMLTYHTGSLSLAEHHAQNAVIYSKIANNPDLLVASLGMNALVLHYANQPEQAIMKCVEAEQYFDRTTYAVQSHLYRRKAACFAQSQQDLQASQTLDLAYETFQRQPASETPLPYAEHNEIELFLWEGITRYHLDQQQNKAIAVLEKLDPREPSTTFPERIRTGFLNNLIFAELRKPAPKRDLERCLTLWQEGAQGAVNLQSELRYGEVVRAYDGLLIAFPGETRLKELRPAMARW